MITGNVNPGVVARLVSIIFAAMPATAMCMYAGFGVFAGFMALGSGEIGGLVMVAWGGGGLFGTAALWAAIFRHHRRWTAIGLAVGILCFVPFSAFMIAMLIEGSLAPAKTDAVGYGLVLLSLTVPLIAAWQVKCNVERLRSPPDADNAHAA